MLPRRDSGGQEGGADMAAAALRGKDLRVLYRRLRACGLQRRRGEARKMAGLALTMFVALFAFGEKFLGWHDPSGEVQLGLFMAFLFGIICGYRTKA
jgi:hypothetical protein